MPLQLQRAHSADAQRVDCFLLQPLFQGFNPGRASKNCGEMQYFCIDVARELVVLIVLFPTRYTLLESDTDTPLPSYGTYAIEHCFASCTPFQFPHWWKASSTRGTERMVERRRMVFAEFADCSVAERHLVSAWLTLSEASQAQREQCGLMLNHDYLHFGHTITA
jgi:hypothetical protein